MNPADLTILYEDNHLIIVNKPKNLLTQPTDIEELSLEGIVKLWIKEKYKKPGNVFLGVIHRLDKPVSGIVVFAKTSKALSRLNLAMRSKQMNKTYTALVEGVIGHDKGTLENYLTHDDYNAKITSKTDPKAKLARLHYKVLKRDKTNTLLEIDLETGRYHQIRAQLSHIGHPIVGDAKYGSKEIRPRGTIELHHSQMKLIHPITQEVLTITSNT